MNMQTEGMLVDRIRAEFLEMPGLKLTARQAARLFAMDARHTTRLLHALSDEGFLVCDQHGAYGRADAAGKRTLRRRSQNADTPHAGHEFPKARSRRPVTDLLEDVGVELPCLSCQRSYRVSLRKIRASQLMMDAGCGVRHFADCPPAAFGHLIDPGVLAEFEAAVKRMEAAAGEAGGLVAAK